MNPAPDDGQEQDLESLRGAWRALSREQPPALIDQAVLNSSRRALERPVRTWPWTRSWIHNLATAAVVVVAVTLLLQLREELPVSGPESSVNESATVTAESASAPQAPKDDPDASPDNALREAADSSLASPVSGAERENSARTSRGQSARIEAETPAAMTAESPAVPIAGFRQEDLLEKSAAADADRRLQAEAAYAQLETLWQSGDQAAFRERLAEFRATWPDYPLPAAWLD